MVQFKNPFQNIKVVYRRSKPLTKVVVIGLILVCTAALITLSWSGNQLRREIALLREEAAVLAAENAELKEKIENLDSLVGVENIAEDELEMVHNLSSLTHRHKRSQMACGIYILIADEFLKGGRDLEAMITDGLKRAQEFYTNDERFESELSYFDRVFSYDIQNLPRDEISSSGYVLSSLEASIWCILNTDSYKDCILKAVNLGFDTDTTACIVGGLAGIYYGYDNLPGEWIDTMVEKDYIDEIIDDFVDSLSLFVK